MIARLFRRAAQSARFEQGARVVTTRACRAGFFSKGCKGSVIAEHADGCYLVHFDGSAPRWVDPTEIERITPRRPSPFFQQLALAWIRLRVGARRHRYTIAWVLVGALAAYAVPHRIASIAAGDHPKARFIVDKPSASSAVRA